MRRKLHTICVALAALLWTSALPAQPTVKIGLILSYSGQFADIATQIDNGVKLYVKQHGDIVVGKKIEIVRKDVGGAAPDVAKRLAQELVVRDQVDIITGFVLTPNALAAADVSVEAKKFMVVMNAATAIITTRSPYMARVSVTLQRSCELLGTWVAENGVKKLYTMVSDYGPGHDAEAAILRSFKERGGEVVRSVRMPVANPDFSAFVQRAKDMAPDGIFVFVPGGAQPPALAKSMVERGIDPKEIAVFGLSEIAHENALKAMGDAGVGIISASSYDHNLGSRKNREFVQAYNTEFGRNPDVFSVGGYDGMHLIYEAVKKAGGKTDGDSLISAAKGAAWESPRGPISIDSETREANQRVYIFRVEKIDGQLRNVEVKRIENVKTEIR